MALVASIAALACSLAAACTAFDDVPLPSKALEAGTFDVDTRETAVDGGVPDVVLPAPGFVTLAEAVDACTVIASCGHLAQSVTRSLRVPVAEAVPATAANVHPAYDTSFSFCVEQLSKTFEPQRPGRDIVAASIRRIAKASSCREAGKGLYLEYLPGTDVHCPTSPDASPWVCIDDVTAVECAPEFAVVFHCNAPRALPAGKCITLDAGRYGIGGCFLPETTGGSCSPTCQGSAALLCDSFPLFPRRYGTLTECSALGLECKIDPGTTNTGCATPGRAPRYDQYRYPGTYCENTNLVLSNGTFVGVLDCASFGGVCAGKNAAAVCTMADAECTPFSPGANTCQGSKIHLCVGGKWQDVECAKGCDAPDGSPQRGACRGTFDDDGG
jgi:hypothetical protein